MSIENSIYKILEDFIKKYELPMAEEQVLIETMRDTRRPIEFIDSTLTLDAAAWKKLYQLLGTSNKQPLPERADTSQGIFTIESSQDKPYDASPPSQISHHFDDLTESIRNKLDGISEQINVETSANYRQNLIPKIYQELLESNSPCNKILTPRDQGELNRIIRTAKESTDRVTVDFSKINTTANGIFLFQARNINIIGKIFEPITLNECHHIILMALDCRLRQPNAHNQHYNQPATVSGIRLMNCSNINLYHCNFIGKSIDNHTLSVISNGVTKKSGNLVRRPIALRINNSTRIELYKCYANNVHNAFEIVRSSYLTCHYNTAHYVMQDVFQCHEITHSDIKNNYRGRILAYQQHQNDATSQDGKLHADFIQVSRSTKAHGQSHNLALEDNYDLCNYTTAILKEQQPLSKYNRFLIQLSKDAGPLVSDQCQVNYAVGIQGIFFRSEVGGKHSNITIRNNIIRSTQHNPLTAKDVDCTSLVIEDNVCIEGTNNYRPDCSCKPTKRIDPNYFKGEGVSYMVKADDSEAFQSGMVVVEDC